MYSVGYLYATVFSISYVLTLRFALFIGGGAFKYKDEITKKLGVRLAFTLFFADIGYANFD